MSFIDEVRKTTYGGDTVLNYIKQSILISALGGNHECTFSRSVKEFDLKSEIQWLKDQGFDVEVWKSKSLYYYYPNITVRW